MRILLVDDDPIIRDLLSSSLTRQGFTNITSACSAEQALKLVDDDDAPFDCFLLDIMLGEMNGIELCRRLRQHPKFKVAPIIMITSSQSTAFMDSAFEAGATDFLRKPLDQVEVAGRIRSAMLLVETMKQEQRGRQALQTLMSHARELDLIDPSHRICFPDVTDMLDYFQLENRLLRLKEGQYQMSLLRLQLVDFQRLERYNDQAGILNLIHTISSKTCEKIKVKHLWFAYIGAGRFIYCMISPSSSIAPPVLAQLKSIACDAIREHGYGKDTDFRTAVQPLTEARILSRDTALALIRKEFDTASDAAAATLPKIGKIEKQLFDKIDNIFSTAGHDN